MQPASNNAAKYIVCDNIAKPPATDSATPKDEIPMKEAN